MFHKNSVARRSNPIVLHKLEDRILFDANPVHGLDLAHALTSVGAQQHIATSDTHDIRHEVVFVDATIADHQTLINGLLQSADAAARVDVFLIDPAADGVGQIADVVAELDGLDAIHVVSHGDQGLLQLGTAVLDAKSIAGEHARSLQRIGNSLADDADFLVYGCDFAGGTTGRAAAKQLGAVLGADVSASEDVTGSTLQRGDWQLEYSHGRIETRSLEASLWSGTLAVEATDGALTVQDAEFSGSGIVSLTNNGSPEVVTTINAPVRVGQMLERVWQFSETAEVGRASFVFDVSGIAGINATIASEFGLIVSDQADLSGANTTTLVASGYDAANGLVYFHQVDLADGDYFGLATEVVTDNFAVSPVATGLEDTLIDLGLVLYPSLTDGGKLRDVIGTDIGFRTSTAGSTTTDFLIPAGTTGIKITAYSTRDINTGNASNDETNDDYQSMNVSIDLNTETSNGFIGHLIDQGPSRSDQFGWSDAPLGSPVVTGGGTITGDADDNINPTFTIVDGVLQIAENHPLQTAYHVDFLTNATSSADFIQTATAVLEDTDQSNATLAVPAAADFLIINIADAATSSDSQVEYKGNSRVYLDLTTLRASGVVAAQRGETNDNVISYAFSDYDVSSAAVGTILSASGSVVGDTAEAAGLLNDNQIYIDGGGNLVINREDTFADNFNSMVTVEYYDRKDAGSSAAQLGESTDYGFWDADPSDPISTLEFDIPDNASLGIMNLSMNGTRTSDTNENMGAGFAIIDLVNGVSSGSIYMVRTSNIVDLVGLGSDSVRYAVLRRSQLDQQPREHQPVQRQVRR